MSYERTASGLLVPYQFVQKGRHTVPLSENPNDLKMIAYKARDKDGQWFGGLIKAPRDVDLDMVDDSGKTLRHAIHLKLMRHLEDSDGRFRYQDGDEAQGVTYIEEWPVSEHSDERWSKFMNRDHGSRVEIRER